MARIRLLDDELINKIAAGEVVERPLSVVKELVENSIDAGATMIRVELEDGGRRLISVTDNGIGIHKDDLALAVHRHATSKIADANDLFHITTMGFRGEALSSIGAVSRLTIMTRQKDSEDGCRFVSDGGAVTASPWHGPFGTIVTVANLFFNVPARQKFLKSAPVEYSYCLDLLRAMALCHPAIEFVLVNNGKEQMHVAPARANDHEIWKGEKQLRFRAAPIFGEEETEAFLYIRKSTNHGCLEALVSPPGFEKPSTKLIYTFVNDRWVKDKIVRQGILRGYHSHLLKGKFPALVMHLTIDPSLVDVNVHPAKTELRFQYASEVQNLIATEIRRVLRSGAWTKEPEPVAAPSTKAALPPDFDLGFTARPREERPRDMSITRTRLSFAAPAAHAPASTRPVIAETSASNEPSPAAARPAAPWPDDGKEETTREEINWREAEYLGVFAKCYLLFASGDKLLAVDQHAFHERILYERLLTERALLLRSQPLLMPEAISFSPPDVALLKEHQKAFTAMGFDFAVLTDAEIEVCAVPSLLTQKNFEDCIADILRSGAFAGSDHLHLTLATMACHAAVRAGEVLSADDLATLLREAESVDFYHNCPHGRRVFRWFSKQEVAHWFDR